MTDHAGLRAVLDAARRAGFLGPGDPGVHLAHALGFAEVIEAVGGVPARLVDLGAGGGVPGLVLAQRWGTAEVTLVEANGRRARHLVTSARELGIEGRVIVWHGRAEDAAHDPALREAFPVAAARGFGRPAVTAEIGAGFVAPGGLLVVSEPPGGDPRRWPAAALAELGFAPAQLHRTAAGTFAVIPKGAPAPAAIPRRSGRPAKRPRW